MKTIHVIPAMLAAGLFTAVLSRSARADAPAQDQATGRAARRSNYHSHIDELTRTNSAYRRVVFTGQRSQLVLMALPPGGEIGAETHAHVEQSFFVVEGHGEARLATGAVALGPGDALVVTPGSRHNVVNTGAGMLRLYTVYAPPNHIAGRVHATRADAQADHEDEAFGNHVR